MSAPSEDSEQYEDLDFADETKKKEEGEQGERSVHVTANEESEGNGSEEAEVIQYEADDDCFVDEHYFPATPPTSMTWALFVYWVIPVLLVVFLARYGADTELPELDLPPPLPPRPVSIDLKKAAQVPTAPYDPNRKSSKMKRSKAKTDKLPQGPASYREAVATIAKRRRQFAVDPRAPSASATYGTSFSPSHASAPSTASQTSTSHRRSLSDSDPAKNSIMGKIEQLRVSFESSRAAHSQSVTVDADGATKLNESNDNMLYTGLLYADAMRYYTLQYHDGGKYETEAIATYQELVDMALKKRNSLIAAGEPTNLLPESASVVGITSVNDEVTLEYPDRSVDGLLCGIYTSLGKIYYMADMFEKAVESYSHCLEDVEPYYLDAVNSRGSARIVLGKYKEAAFDFLAVIKRDRKRLFNDAFTGLERILETKEDVVPGGWDTMMSFLDNLVPAFETKYEATPEKNTNQRKLLGGSLNRFHHVLFTYHDTKTKDYDLAWDHLTTSFKYKMALLPPWQKGSELMKIQQAKGVFTKTFWPQYVGNDSRIPVFIIGFVRSGSTLLERILDAHPNIVGMGENSVFNGRLDDIRNRIVKASAEESTIALVKVTNDAGNEVIAEMKRRWKVKQRNNNATCVDGDAASCDTHGEPLRFVDKMLTNYNNVGIIHLVYPNALILHVARNPMDTLLSAYKHEFPSGMLDYTSDLQGLAELYRAYREIMLHWDDVLPGRVTHIRYEDMVHDTPGIAKAIIENAAGLEWDDSVLDFHKKKHAVNTLSTTQVRRGIYKDSLQAWKRYEKHLQPLKDLVGEMSEYDLRTTLPNYSPPEPSG
jgi:tetratricopeptide (TPR) repeat protein